jgi:hypothetical protein
MNLAQENRSFSKAPLFVFLCFGLFFAVSALIMQGGHSSGYASIYMLFLSFGLAILLVIAGIVALALRRPQAGCEMIASACILPTTYLLVLFGASYIIGE